MTRSIDSRLTALERAAAAGPCPVCAPRQIVTSDAAAGVPAVAGDGRCPACGGEMPVTFVEVATVGGDG